MSEEDRIKKHLRSLKHLMHNRVGLKNHYDADQKCFEGMLKRAEGGPKDGRPISKPNFIRVIRAIWKRVHKRNNPHPADPVSEFWIKLQEYVEFEVPPYWNEDNWAEFWTNLLDGKNADPGRTWTQWIREIDDGDIINHPTFFIEKVIGARSADPKEVRKPKHARIDVLLYYGRQNCLSLKRVRGTTSSRRCKAFSDPSAPNNQPTAYNFQRCKSGVTWLKSASETEWNDLYPDQDGRTDFLSVALFEKSLSPKTPGDTVSVRIPLYTDQPVSTFTFGVACDASLDRVRTWRVTVRPSLGKILPRARFHQVDFQEPRMDHILTDWKDWFAALHKLDPEAAFENLPDADKHKRGSAKEEWFNAKSFLDTLLQKMDFEHYKLPSLIDLAETSSPAYQRGFRFATFKKANDIVICSFGFPGRRSS